ncbi:RTA1 like protein-domain-containing protein [Mycena olivaceomarginata]|nr:RTA1 like protein-domain-containing protein [Mycena olivaceomarginata]
MDTLSLCLAIVSCPLLISFRTVTLSILGIRDHSTTEDDAQYGYIPHESIAIVFLTLFGISTLLHVGQATYYRTWWLLPTAALCGLTELLGWSGRLWSAISPTADTPFLIQISTTIMAPTPLLAANFMIFSRIIQQLGTSYSRLTPKWCTCDIIALVIQGVGGWHGFQRRRSRRCQRCAGAHVMLGGIVFQFAVIVVFSILAVDTVQRYWRDRPVRFDSSQRGVLTARLKIMLSALRTRAHTEDLMCDFRSIYRLIELLGGWNGRIIHTEVYFNVLDGGMVVLAIFTFNFAHPGLLLEPQSRPPHEGRGNSPREQGQRI